MGGMSASDAAPLPRLGEVFFDVRGNSRSMRLSWYADTGVAVLSIWQGGMCTGTFRLAIADLPRMVETLQRGPGGPRPEWDSEAPGQTFAQVPRVATGQAEVMNPLPGQDRAGPGHRTGPASYETQYPAEAPGGPRTGEPPGHRTVPPDYLAEPGPRRPSAPPASGPVPPSHRRSVPPAPGAAPPSHRTGPPEYLAELPDDPRTGALPRPSAPPEYLPAPPDDRTRPPGHAAGPPDYPAGPGGYPAPPPDHRTEYLADLPGTGQAGQADYDRVPDAGRRSGAWNPGADADAPYPRGTRGEGGYPDPLAGGSYPGGAGPADYQDSHLGGAGPADYRDSPYPPGPSAPGHGDVPAPGSADYPAPYSEAVTGDIPTGPAPGPAPYDRPPGRHGATSRHAAPDVRSG
jgi:hypothetical protein